MNETVNDAMRVLVERAPPRDATRLDPGLATYVDEGLAINADGSIVSVAAARGVQVEPGQFEDLVGYEAFANKVHLDDWMSERLAAAPLEEKLAHARLLADAIGRLAEQSDLAVVVIISADTWTNDVVLRFHGIRPDELPWLADIEHYREPVLARTYRPSMGSASP